MEFINRFLDRFFRKNKQNDIKAKIYVKLEGVEEIKEQIEILEERLRNLKITVSVGD